MYIAPQDAYFQRAEQRFRSAVKRPLEADVSGEILRYFRIRKKWENHEYVIPVTADLEFLNEARGRFHGEKFESFYKGWSVRDLTERSVYFATYLVNGHRSPLTVPNRHGDGCMKDTLHVERHGSRHLGGDAKVLGA